MVVDKNLYNQEELKKFRKKRNKKRALRFSIYAVVFLLFLVVSADYFARFPRERHAKRAPYHEKVWLGFKKFAKASKLVLTAENEDPKNTKLPIAELYIKGHRQDKLNENLPFSGEKYQKAQLKLFNKTYKVEAKYKGDSINHWAFPQKSWRVKLKKDKQIDGMQTFNLNVPRLDTQIGNYLGYTLGSEMKAGLIPEVDYVHFRLNRQYAGVRLLLEQPDQKFLLRRNLPAGKIYNGDIDYLQIYGNVKREKLFSEIEGWDLSTPGDYLSGNDELKQLLNIIAYEHNPYKFYEKINEILDVESFLRYIALLEIVSSVHVDETHNQKLYFNPIAGKFYPIVWDTVAYHWKNKYNPDIAVNKLFRVLLSNPEFRERKDKILYSVLNNELATEKIISIVSNIVKKVAPDLKSFPLKLTANDKGITHISNEEWENSINELVDVIKKRNHKLLMHLGNSDVSYNFKNRDKDNSALLNVSISGPIGVKLSKLIITAKNDLNNQININRRGLNDLEEANNVKTKSDVKFKILSKTDKTIRFELDDHLFSKRRYNNAKNPEVVAGNYYYEFKGLTIEKVKIVAKNYLTDKRVNIRFDSNLKLANQHKANSVWWKPSAFTQKDIITISGEKILLDNLYVKENQILNIVKGSKIKIAPRKGIIVKGSLNVNGDPNNKVLIESLDPKNPMGGLALNNANGNIKYLNIKGGLGLSHNFVNYEAPVTFYNSSVNISNSSFLNSNIIARYSNLEVLNSTYRGVLEQGLLSFSSTLNTNDFKNEQLKAVHSKNLVNEKAYGTPSRAEREFKFSLIGVDFEKQNLEELALEVNKALSKNNTHWSAPKFTNTKYYLDDDIGKFLFRDYYFDTNDYDLYKKQISYRYRNRYSNLKEYKLHLKNPFLPEYWPYRLEFQAKVNRKEVGNGFSTVDEARFEFRKESAPFSTKNPPPKPPWNEDEYFNYFQAGNFRGLNTLPAKVIMESLNFKDRDVSFAPKLLLLTERFRQHFNIKSNYGSGPNPDQAYIISLDKVEVFNGEDYSDYVIQKKLGDKKLEEPAKLGVIIEIEVEFERNVSDILDREIKKAQIENNKEEEKKLVAVREAFLEDLQNIMNTIKDYFADKGIDVKSATRSKYLQAVDLSQN